MCFASSIVESHRKLFIAAPGAAAADCIGGTYATSSAEKATGKAKLGKMSRTKSRLQTEICGDCGASDPSWASINRGILLCADCCSVHRSLGRHISIVKSLRHGNWEPSVLNFVNSLNAHGANSVWEHHLLDGLISGGGSGIGGGGGGGGSGSSKNSTRYRKPTPKDALHPNKSDFIKAKHVNLAFVLKPNLHDEDIGADSVSIEHELSKQLHASVRTSNLETSLRLLVQGADPNFFHEEKRSTPLHVAAKFGQASQIELLIVYGGDLNAIDGNGLTPLEVAKANNHNTIAERLLDALYDVTDAIIVFLGGKKPDHASGRHLIIPESNSGEINEQLKIARGRLQLVPNKMFEELVMDLYDEVDRRENEAIWATTTLNAENVAVPFLPANPFLSATRNQGRQKLARFSRTKFAGLLTDVLIDARRRQNMANLRPMDATNSGYYNPTMSSYNNNDHDPYLSDDEPIYDPVASDDDYAPVMPISKQESQQEMEILRKQLNEYKFEINQLKTVVQKLSSENSELKSKFSNVSQTASNSSVYDEPLRIDLNGSETNDNEPLSLPSESCNGAGAAGIVVDSISSSTSSASATDSNQSTIRRPASMYERRLATNNNNSNNGSGSNSSSGHNNKSAENRATASMYQMAIERSLGDEVKHRTDLVTRRLKELILTMQLETPKKEAFVPCAERIRVAVMELIAVFAATNANNCNEIVRETLNQLTRYNVLLQRECEYLEGAYNVEDKANIEKYIKEVRDCAYYIASSTKTLVMQFE